MDSRNRECVSTPYVSLIQLLKLHGAKAFAKKNKYEF